MATPLLPFHFPWYAPRGASGVFVVSSFPTEGPIQSSMTMIRKVTLQHGIYRHLFLYFMSLVAVVFSGI